MTEEEILDKYSNKKDNYGKPRVDYINKVIAMTDKELMAECEQKIWLSAYANNNPRSDYHWQCDACYEIAHSRDKGDIYSRAYEKIEASI